jgi:undecaprenyl-diphosphatase
MSAPIIFGAGLVKVKDFMSEGLTLVLVAGFISAAVFGFLSIRFLLSYLAKHDFKVFVWYRFALAALVLGIYFIRK